LKPWAGLSTVALVVAQAIATAALIRLEGYNAAWIKPIFLCLLRPRMQWVVTFFYTIFGKQYKQDAIDALFADGVLNLITPPILAWFIEASFKDSYCFNNISLYDATSN
jgi:hypothetical protein